jgi:hypothetical protein
LSAAVFPTFEMGCAKSGVKGPLIWGSKVLRSSSMSYKRNTMSVHMKMPCTIPGKLYKYKSVLICCMSKSRQSLSTVVLNRPVC